MLYLWTFYTFFLTEMFRLNQIVLLFSYFSLSWVQIQTDCLGFMLQVVVLLNSKSSLHPEFLNILENIFHLGLDDAAIAVFDC